MPPLISFTSLDENSCAARSWQFTTHRNGADSSAVTIPKDVTVLLLDSIGELASLYRCADGVFVGGSLVP